MLPLRQN